MRRWGMIVGLVVLMSGGVAHGWDEDTQGPFPWPLMSLPGTHLVAREGIITWNGPTDPRLLSQMVQDFWGFWTARAPISSFFLELPLPVHGDTPMALRLSQMDTETRQLRCESPLPLDVKAHQVLTLLGCDAQEVL